MVSVILGLAFILPLIIGAAGLFTRERMRYSLSSLIGGIESVAGIVLSIYFVKRIFFEHDGSIYSKIYDILPSELKNLLLGQDILTYIVAVPLILMLLLVIMRLLTSPLYRYVVIPASDRLYQAVSKAGPFARRLAGALWELPKAAVAVLLVALLFNFSMYYVYSPVLTGWLNGSKPYKLVYDKALYPILNSNLAKKIPVLVNDAFGRTASGFVPNEKTGEAGKSIEELTGGRIKIIEYFNGVTIDKAIKSNEAINQTVKKIIGKETDNTKMAYLLYKWICKNIEYDYGKAAGLAADPSRYSSGSVPAFETRKGICFDYSCLYVTMCRTAGLKVRLVTGLGYSGTAWGDHAWNQVWDESGERWINVDATFGSTGANYFDKPDFQVDHRETEIQGEW